MRDTFDRAYLRGELERLGNRLDDPVVSYLLGGGAMVFRGVKDTTKDIDLVVGTGDDLARIQTALQESGYELVRDPAATYEALGAQRILENSAGCRFDLFNRQVVDKLVLTDTMRERAVEGIETGDLTVSLVHSSDIFLFKAVAGRPGDIEDMYTLIQSGLDFETIEAELHTQIEVLDQELFVTYVNEALLDLEATYGVETPLRSTVTTITDRVYEELAVLNGFEGETVSIERLREAVEISHDDFESVLGRLVEKGVVERTNGQVSRQEGQP